MFDYIKCEIEIPELKEINAQNTLFQTKDLECTMSYFIIAQNGKLYEEVYHSVALKEPKYHTFLNQEIKIDREWVSTGAKKEYFYPLRNFNNTYDHKPFHGYLEFYDYITIDHEHDYYVEALAKFDNGFCERIETSVINKKSKDN